MNYLKSLIPVIVKESVWQSKLFWRQKTSRLRLLPDFIIIGAQRCGTTTLYHSLVQHPQIAPALGKEVHYFDLEFAKGVGWYRSNFITSLHRLYVEQVYRRSLLVGEASPYYIFHPHVPKRVAQLLPTAKLILILRDPVDRAYSHYYNEVRWGFETALSFEEAIDLEEERLHGEIDKMLANEHYYSYNHHHYTYLTRGIYVDQLERWLKFFPREQIMIINSEDFNRNTQVVFKQVLDFLNLPAWDLPEYKNYNQANNPKIAPETKVRLLDYFAPHNRRLTQYIDFGF